MDHIESLFDTFTPLQKAINDATDQQLQSPRWELNLSIVDAINAGDPKRCQTGIKQIFRRLGCRGQNIVFLALVLLEACMKNCTFNFHLGVGKKDRMRLIVNLANGKKGHKIQNKALDLISQWGLAFKHMEDILPIFTQTYTSLKAEGARFPQNELISPVFTPPRMSESAAAPAPAPAPSQATDDTPLGVALQQRHSQSGPTDALPSDPSRSAVGLGTRADQRARVVKKLEADLGGVEMQLQLCNDMMGALTEPAGQAAPEALVDGVDFLDQCSPRLLAVIEAGVSGRMPLSESVLGRVFAAHDAVGRAIERFIRLERSGFRPDPKAAPALPSTALPSFRKHALPSTAPIDATPAVSMARADEVPAPCDSDLLGDIFSQPVPTAIRRGDVALPAQPAAESSLL